MTELTITSASSLSEADRLDLLEIYHGSFPAIEQKPDSLFLGMFSDDSYFPLVVRQGGSAIGFSLTKKVADGVYVLEYMALHSRSRGLGLGSLLFENVTKSIGEASTLILEVDDDKPGDRFVENRRRKQFYFSHGCKEISELNYIMPLDEKRFEPMNLMIWSRGHAFSVDKKTIKGWIIAIYDSLYNKDFNDKRVEKMMHGLEESVKLKGG